MDDVLVPIQIKFSDILSNKYNLSPTNYKKVDVKTPNKVKLKSLLDSQKPVIRGTEPGTSAYIKDVESKIKFVRNSCVDKLNTIVQLQRTIFLNEMLIYFSEEQLLENEDIIVSTDANIGDSAIFTTEEDYKFLLSSGMVKLKLKNDVNKYYLLAMLKDNYFNAQLDSMTPKGSTIRHSGTKLLDCYISFPDENENWVINIVENLMKNIIFAEKRVKDIQEEIMSVFDAELNNIPVEETKIKFSDLFSIKRVDAGFYSKEVQEFFKRIEKYSSGNKTLAELGYKTKRGPSLQKRDLGRSIKTEIFKPNYSLLVYPSDISDYGIIDKTVFLGASGKVWFLEENDILFSAEGNVGKTFAVCDNSLRFTTNIHGIIITPINKDSVNIKNAIFICTFLNYMKRKGIMDKLSVGGQGGSFAVQYWDLLKFPNIREDVLLRLKELYFSEYEVHPFVFDENEINKLGVYEINKLRTLCSSLLKLLINDIKSDNIRNKDYYFNQIKEFI